MTQTRFILTLLILLAFASATQLLAQEVKEDRHAGLYYPKPQVVESYKSRSGPIPGVDRTGRIAFVVGFSTGEEKLGYERPWVIFVKGGDAEKLIIVSKFDGRLNTTYRVRALLAHLTSRARKTPILIESQVQDYFTFLDYLGMLGFKKLTVSDGNDFTHQIDIN